MAENGFEERIGLPMGIDADGPGGYYPLGQALAAEAIYNKPPVWGTGKMHGYQARQKQLQQ